MAKVRIIGAADGIIIATIISAHIRKSGRIAPAAHGFTSGPDIARPAQWQTPVASIARASRIM